MIPVNTKQTALNIVSFAMLFVVGMFIGVEIWNYCHYKGSIYNFVMERITIALPILILSLVVLYLRLHDRKRPVN